MLKNTIIIAISSSIAIPLCAQQSFILQEVKKTAKAHTYIFHNKKTKKDFKIVIEKGDITKKTTQAIVNAANEAIWMPQLGGVAQTIINKAGNKEIKNYVSSHFPADNNGVRCKTGSACTTPAFRLEKQGVKKIIHAVGPLCNNPKQPMSNTDKHLLRQAYNISLQQADANDLTSIAFPFISSNIFACNKKDAAEVALQAVRDYLEKFIATSLKEVDFVLFSDEDFNLFLTQALNVYK